MDRADSSLRADSARTVGRSFLHEGRKCCAAGLAGCDRGRLSDQREKDLFGSLLPSCCALHPLAYPYGNSDHGHAYQQGRSIRDEVIERSLLPARRPITAQLSWHRGLGSCRSWMTHQSHGASRTQKLTLARSLPRRCEPAFVREF
jgi:hypothetical protein